MLVVIIMTFWFLTRFVRSCDDVVDYNEVDLC